MCQTSQMETGSAERFIKLHQFFYIFRYKARCSWVKKAQQRVYTFCANRNHAADNKLGIYEGDNEVYFKAGYNLTPLFDLPAIEWISHHIN